MEDLRSITRGYGRCSLESVLGNFKDVTNITENSKRLLSATDAGTKLHRPQLLADGIEANNDLVDGGTLRLVILHHVLYEAIHKFASKHPLQEV